MTRIAIDGVPAAKEHKTGVEWYVWHLLRAMNALRPDLEVTVYTHRSLDFELTGRWRNRVVRAPRGLWKGVFALRFMAERPNVLFVPGDTPPPVPTGKVVTTVHDIAFRNDPHLYTAIERLRQRMGHWWTVQRSARLIAVSETTRQDIMAHYGVDADHITVVPLGIDHVVYNPSARDRLATMRATHDLPNDYFVFVGRLDARKGVADLIRAFLSWRTHQTLVLIGPSGEIGYEEIHELAGRDGIRELGYINPRYTAAIVAGAKAFVFPTKKEGFGMPILEAMAVGTPVICSSLPVLREVGGDVPIFVDRESAAAWHGAFDEVVMRDQQDRIARGKERAERYTWDAAARATLDILCSI